MLLRTNKYCFYIILILFVLVVGCASLFPVTQNNKLSDIVLTRVKMSKYNIMIDYASKVPDNYQHQFEEGVVPQPYNINSQIKNMYQEYFSLKSNQSSNIKIIVHLTIDSFEITYQIEGGLGAQLSGMANLERTAIIQLTVQIKMPDGTIHNQKVIGKGIHNLQNIDTKVDTWMQAYSLAINNAINKSIITTDSFIDSLNI